MTTCAWAVPARHRKHTAAAAAMRKERLRIAGIPGSRKERRFYWLRGCGFVSGDRIGRSGAAREHRDFLAIVVELACAQVDTARASVAHDVQAQARLVEALLHRQLEVEHREPAPPAGEPFGHARGDAARLLDHVADHPVDGALRLVA